MRTWKIIIKPKKNAALSEYFSKNTADAKCMYNVANFYIRNTMTGIRKSPEERAPNETEVLHYVFTGIQRANALARVRYEEKLKKYQDMKSKEGDQKAAKLKCTVFSYPTREKWFLSYNVLDAVFKHTDHPTYRRMNSQVNQNAIKKAVANWTSYFKAVKDYKIHPEKYKARPGIPKYKKDLQFTASFTYQTAAIVFQNGFAYLRFVKHKPLVLIGKEMLYSGMKYVKTEVKPQYGNYIMLVTFDDGMRPLDAPEHPKRILGVDVGVSNFLAVANNFGDTPFLIKGGAVRSMNQNFNRQRAKLLSAITKGSDSTHSRKETKQLNHLSQKRTNFLRDFFYKTAWYLIKYAKAQQVDVIVIGHNEDQKQNLTIGSRNNQHFVSIPFYQFIEILKSVAMKAKIAIVSREESYTSKASLLDLDDIPTYKKGSQKIHTFSGKRMKRGLYQTKQGICLNADINGAGNILRKEYPDAFDGQDMSYLYRTTKVVSYTDIYTEAKSICKPKYNQKCHQPGSGSRVNHRYRKEIRLSYRILWGRSKTVWKAA